MNLYLAAIYTNQYGVGQTKWPTLFPNEQEIIRNVPNVLESYHYVKNPRYVNDMRNAGAKVFLDSGAFSAYTLGATLTVEEYCKYIKDNSDLIRIEDGTLMFSVLDGIGDPLLTYQNQKKMEALGCTPLPCFHAGEDERYLEYYIANYPYITLGGMVGASGKQLTIWLDRMFENYIVDGAGVPKCKVHGFGITAIDIMRRYPWYSCDSSSWVQKTSFGAIMDPKHGSVFVSDKSPARHTAGQHAESMSQMETDYLIKRWKSQGFEYKDLSERYLTRAAYNMWAYNEIGKEITDNQHYTHGNYVQELF